MAQQIPGSYRTGRYRPYPKCRLILRAAFPKCRTAANTPFPKCRRMHMSLNTPHTHKGQNGKAREEEGGMRQRKATNKKEESGAVPPTKVPTKAQRLEISVE